MIARTLLSSRTNKCEIGTITLVVPWSRINIQARGRNGADWPRADVPGKIPSVLSRAPERQRKLLRHRRPVALDEVFQTLRDLPVPFGKPFRQLVGDVIGHV